MDALCGFDVGLVIKRPVDSHFILFSADGICQRQRVICNPHIWPVRNVTQRRRNCMYGSKNWISAVSPRLWTERMCAFNRLRIGVDLWKVPYVSHVFDAGVVSFCGYLVSKQLRVLRNPMTAATAPVYDLQRNPDNLGWAWQSNIFGHFALSTPLYRFREPEILLPRQNTIHPNQSSLYTS
jgi:hypothetical protein